MEKWIKLNLEEEDWSALKKGGKKSLDEGINQMYAKAQKEKIETGWDRYRQQIPQCLWGLDGTCCRRCFNGPCRIKPGVKRGICGASADTIVMRNLLEMWTAGSAQHIEHAREVLVALSEGLMGKAPYKIKDKNKLLAVANALGIKTKSRTIRAIAKEVFAKTFEDYQKQEGTLNWLNAIGDKNSIKKWQELGVLPKNVHAEIAMSAVRTSMGCDADPANLLLEMASMGIVDGFGLHVGTQMQDVLFGTPHVVKTESRLGVIKEEYVNVAVHGHLPNLSEKVLEWSKKLESEAKKVGAEGVNVVGICCTGNELMMRHGVPLATNFAGQEMAIMTGALDAFVVDVQCIMPNVQNVADCYHTKVITTLPYIKIPGATYVNFEPANADEAAKKIVRLAISAYTKRDKKKIEIPEDTMQMLGGFSVEQTVQALAKVNSKDPLKPLVDNIANGNILGAVALVGCANFKTLHDYGYVEIAKELLKNNVLLVATGCAGHALARQGFMKPDSDYLKYCGDGLRSVLKAVGEANGLPSLPPVLHMGSCLDNSRVATLLKALADRLKVGIAALPVAGSCAEIQSVKALSIGGYFLTLGVDVHVGIPFPVSGSEFATKVMTADKGKYPVTLDGIFGSKLIMEVEPKRAAKALIGRIKAKRKALGLKV